LVLITTGVYINGYASVPPSRHYEKGVTELFAESTLKALEAAGNPRIRMIYMASALMELTSEQLNAGNVLREYIGLKDVPTMRVENGDGSSSLAMLAAVNDVKLKGGCVMVVGIEKPHEVTSTKLNKFISFSTNSEYEAFFGVTPAAQAAIMAREYMNKYEYSYEDIAVWPLKMHERGAQNPNAYFKKAVKMKDILESELVADPLRLYDVAPYVDGSAAIIVCSEPNKRDAIIQVSGAGMGVGSAYFASKQTYAALESVKPAVDQALAESSMELEDIRVINVHDTYSIIGLMTLEAMGFSPQGMAPRLMRDGAFDPGSKVVANMDGGLKAMGFPIGASGLYQLISSIAQLRGEKPFESLNADAALVHDMVGIDQESIVTALRRGD